MTLYLSHELVHPCSVRAAEESTFVIEQVEDAEFAFDLKKAERLRRPVLNFAPRGKLWPILKD
jgi:hypothetical protein